MYNLTMINSMLRLADFDKIQNSIRDMHFLNPSKKRLSTSWDQMNIFYTMIFHLNTKCDVVDTKPIGILTNNPKIDHSFQKDGIYFRGYVLLGCFFHSPVTIVL